MTGLFKQIKSAATPAEQRTAYGNMASIVGILCNVALFVAKLLIGIAAASVSIMADAVNNLTDATSSIVTLLGFRMAAKPADPEHPYGHARMEYFSAMLVAVFILIIAVELGKSSFQKILHPEPIVFSAALVIVLVLSIAGKLWLSWYFKKIGKKIDSKALVATSEDSRNDVISTAAVLVCCIIGRVSGLMIDGYVGLLVALFILYSGITLMRETLNPLLGEAPSPELVEELTAHLLSEPLVLGIHDLIIHDYGPGRQFASVHAEMDAKADPIAAHEVLDQLERTCMANHFVELTIHYDPIVTDDAQLLAMRNRVEAVIKAIDERLSLHDFRMVCGAHHTNLIFDLVVPLELKAQCASLKKRIDAEIQSDDGMKYFTVISFDDETFNHKSIANKLRK